MSINLLNKQGNPAQIIMLGRVVKRDKVGLATLGRLYVLCWGHVKEKAQDE